MLMAGQKAAEKPKSAGNQPGLSSRPKKESRNILFAGLGGHQDFLISSLRRRGPLGNKGHLEVINDAVDHGIVREEGAGVPPRRSGAPKDSGSPS
jgi:hypothetical protein